MASLRVGDPSAIIPDLAAAPWLPADFMETKKMQTNSPNFPVLNMPDLKNTRLPTVARVQIRHPLGNPINDLDAAMLAEVKKAKKLNALPKGAKIAVTAGSRGVARLNELVRAMIRALKAQGFEPFVVPAMGSHGGATAEGQTEVLRELGVTEEYIGAPIRSSMEVVKVGKTDYGVDCHFDKNAFNADGVVVMHRVKPHPSFDRDIESGLIKMIAIGLGKQQGAFFTHKIGPDGMLKGIPAMAKVALEKANIKFGLAVVENALKQVVVVEGVEPENFFERDRALLVRAKEMTPKLPMDDFDVLVVQLIGKNITGAGIDSWISGRADIRGIENPKPFVRALTCLGVTPECHGNAVGIGVFDFTTKGVADQLDLYAIYMNAMTASLSSGAKMPLVLPTELDAIKGAVSCSWRVDEENARLAIIKGSNMINEIFVSPALWEEIKNHPAVTKVSDFAPMRFDNEGKLLTRI
jgi:Lactate racemase N-terminal domain